MRDPSWIWESPERSHLLIQIAFGNTYRPTQVGSDTFLGSVRKNFHWLPQRGQWKLQIQHLVKFVNLARLLRDFRVFLCAFAHTRMPFLCQPPSADILFCFCLCWFELSPPAQQGIVVSDEPCKTPICHPLMGVVYHQWWSVGDGRDWAI